jgi:HSP20 family protein
MRSIALYHPNTIQNALSDFDRYFESFFEDSILGPATRMINHFPAVDIRETESAYLLDMELPGYDEKNVDVHIDGSSLSIASKKEDCRESSGEAGETEAKSSSRDKGIFMLRERRMSTFNRSFKLPENANPEAVSASFKNGVLSLEIKKRPEAQKRTIQINAA